MGEVVVVIGGYDGNSGASASPPSYLVYHTSMNGWELMLHVARKVSGQHLLEMDLTVCSGYYFFYDLYDYYYYYYYYYCKCWIIVRASSELTY